MNELQVHQGSAILQGRLTIDGSGKLALLEAGFQFIEPKPATEGETDGKSG